ncbi:hypothetical protein FHW79_001686 [Azospirillum sp. OGB3]|uniref:hypothetical protein n=1 Tax=Azospirillum sp. OGB3 TaxID=2587012 RepID=UPI0016058572|nr:hypothetical protein [Azospirillum sp. OGB3]MBB3264071.1 hypothetical protein [Azospirillum sp. OGB3]
MPWLAIVSGIISIYTAIGFFISIDEWQKVRKYTEKCQEEIDRKGTDEEKAAALIGFYGRNNKGLFDILLNNLSMPDKIFLLSSEPNLIIEANSASAATEKETGIATLEQKYCSDIKRP